MPRTLQETVAVLVLMLLWNIFVVSATGNKIPNSQAIADDMGKCFGRLDFLA
jgi:hypothetical protein